MKKIILMITMIIACIQAWEVNTHRAIDKVAIENVKTVNLKTFLTASHTKDMNFTNEKFEDYGMTYFEYFNKEKSSDGMAELGQKFSKKHNYQDLMEAGCMLEDAVWPNAYYWNGRFLNHFYDPQNKGKGLRVFRVQGMSALLWAEYGPRNKYSYKKAREYFNLAFSSDSKEERKTQLAKMFVSVGHLMHLFNDMNVPAHTRSDSHPEGDTLEVWMRGGEYHNGSTGFYILGNTLAGELKDLNAEPNHFTDFKVNFTSEAERTGKEFLSKDAMFDDLPLPSLDGVNIEKREYGEIKYAVKGDIVLSRARKSYLWADEYIYFIDDSAASNPVHRSYGKVLIPRAIANATGFLNYFFRGSMSVNSGDGVVTVSNDSDENVVASPDIVTFKNGTLKFYCDDANDTRSEFHSEDITDTAVGNELASIGKDTLYADFQNNDCNKSKNVTILFDGTIGKERGLSVAVIPASSIIPQDNGGTNNGGSNADNNNTGGGGNGDNNTSDPTKDPNKVCVSKFFHYGKGKIIEDLQKGDKDAYNEETGDGYSDGTKHQVKELQKFLQAFKYDVGNSGADGWFGSDTKNALIQFQDKNGLDPDGIVGPNTRDAMNSQNCYDK